MEKYIKIIIAWKKDKYKKGICLCEKWLDFTQEKRKGEDNE